MLKRHIFGALMVLSGALFINHFFLAHIDRVVCVTTPCPPIVEYPTPLIIAIFISLFVGFGIMLGYMRIKNV